MKQEIKYDLKNEEEAIKKALADAKWYMGMKQFNKIAKALPTLNNSFQAYFIIEMNGVQGFPATQMIKKYAPQLLEKKEKVQA